MTLSFSSFSIKDILTGRDDRGKPGNRSTEELCAPKRNVCTAQDGTGVPGLSHQDSLESCIQSERLPADLRLSFGSRRSDTYSDEATGEETERREGEFYSIRQYRAVEILWFYTSTKVTIR